VRIVSVYAIGVSGGVRDGVSDGVSGGISAGGASGVGDTSGVSLMSWVRGGVDGSRDLRGGESCEGCERYMVW
jgi:hypothetical protein